MPKRFPQLPKRLIAASAPLVAAGSLAAAALSTAPPVGSLPPGPVQTVKSAVGKSFTVTLPKPDAAGRTWRVARAYDARVVRQVAEGTKANGAIWVSYRAVAPGNTNVVYALTRGETARAFAARTFRVVVSPRTATACPTSLLPLTANPIGPAVTAALVSEQAKNRPQVTAAAIASHDTQRGPQVKAQCGSRVQQRTIVVYITDRALLPSESLSQRVFFVGRTSAGYQVWERAH